MAMVEGYYPPPSTLFPDPKASWSSAWFNFPPDPSFLSNGAPGNFPPLPPPFFPPAMPLAPMTPIATPTPLQPMPKKGEKRQADDEIQSLRRQIQKLSQSLSEQKRQIAIKQSVHKSFVHKLQEIESGLGDSVDANVKLAIQNLVKDSGLIWEEPVSKSAFHEPAPKVLKVDVEEASVSSSDPKEEKLSSPSNVSSQQKAHKNRDRYCKPCRLINNVSKTPFRTVTVSVQKQFTMSKKETIGISKEDKEKLVIVPVRIMGSADPSNLFFVAKDVCLLIHTRKGNVAKSIGQFDETEKARMPVLCPRSNGTVSTHILTVLSIKGVKRLLNSSRSSRAPHVLRWIMAQVDNICGTGTSQKS